MVYAGPVFLPFWQKDQSPPRKDRKTRHCHALTPGDRGDTITTVRKAVIGRSTLNTRQREEPVGARLCRERGEGRP